MQGEELYETAAVHLTPNICLCPDGLGALRKAGAVCCVGKTAVGMRGAVLEDRAGFAGSGCKHCSEMGIILQFISGLFSMRYLMQLGLNS